MTFSTFHSWSRYMAVASGTYLLYLLILGPFWALSGRGLLDIVPQSIQDACWWPAIPVYTIPGLRHLHADYIDWWYLDPNAADMPTGW